MKYSLTYVPLLFLLIISCKTRQVTGDYSRFFKIEDGTLPFYEFEKMTLKADSTYTISTYKYYDKQKGKMKDSSFVEGRYSIVKGHLFLRPQNFAVSQFCLRYKNEKLFYYKCDSKARIKFSVPLKRISE